MSKGQKLVNKMKRRERSVLEGSKKWKAQPKTDKRADTLQDSPGAQRAMRHTKGRLDRNFGHGAVQCDPKMEYRFSAPALARFDYDPGAGTDFGIRMTLPNPTQVAAAEVRTVLCVADTAGSLNNKYWLLDSPSTDYFIWYNVNGAGVAPVVPGRTAAVVALATGATAAQVATATRAVVDALAEFVAPAPGAATITITDAATGAAPDAANGPGGSSPGFTITTTIQGQGELGPFNGAVGLQPGDTVQVLEGALAGRMLEVVAITDSTHVRLDDVATFTSDTTVQVRVVLGEASKSYF